MNNRDTTRNLQDEGLEILEFFHNVCSENNLNYVLDYGTLLGAIRHKGYIPWDDDVDVAMKREDFDKFEKIMQKTNNDFFLQTNKTDKNYYFTFAKLRKPSDNYIESGTSHFDIVNGAWIDIFIYDHQYSDSNAKEKMVDSFNSKIRFIRRITPVIYPEHYPKQNKIKTNIKKTIKLVIELSQKLPYRGFIMRLLDYKYKKLCRFIRDVGGNGISRTLITFSFPIDKFTSKQSLELDESVFSNRILVKFENLSVYVPIDYDSVLKHRYGDYMELPRKENRISNHIWY